MARVFGYFSLLICIGVFMVSPILGILLCIVPAAIFGSRLRDEMRQNTLKWNIQAANVFPEPLPKVAEKSAAAQIHDLNAIEIPELIEIMPYNGRHDQSFDRMEKDWIFKFECVFPHGRFFARASGKSPREAFLLARHLIFRQLKEWHRVRFVARDGEAEDSKAEPRKVLIIDDDVDVASAMQVALTKLGYPTEVATRHEEAFRALASTGADLILMDWRLNDAFTAGDVVLNAIHLIDGGSDRKVRLKRPKARVITHSVLDRDDIRMPRVSGQYFQHFDHWQKPLPLTEVVARMSELLEVCEQGGNL